MHKRTCTGGYNIIAEGEEEYSHNINIIETEGYREVTGTEIEILDITKPLKTKKVNIRS